MTKNQELAKVKAQNTKLLKMLKEERQKTAGYDEVSKIQNAYIAILLRKMGANEENPVSIVNEEVLEAMNNFEARAVPGGGGTWKFYVEEIKE